MKSFHLPFLLLLLLIGPWELCAQNSVNGNTPQLNHPPAIPYYPQSERVPGGGILTFEEEIHDFGEMMQGGDASWTFRFTNTGTEAILIEYVKSTCGCLVAKRWTREPIQPNEMGEIDVKYDSNRVGSFNKMLIINSNASEPVKNIYVKGVIVPRPTDPTFEGFPAHH